MSDWKAKRFWKTVTVEAQDDGFTIRLDARPVRTPSGLPLMVPTRALANRIAAEWDAQEGQIDPGVMPATRMANSAIEKVRPQQDAVAGLLADYAETDLLCYRAERPEALVERQTDRWDPLLRWAAERFDAPLRVAKGIMPVDQSDEVLARLTAPMGNMTDFQMVAFHDLVSLSGSFVLALAVTEGRLDPDSAWDLSRLDEDWQAEQWGDDEEAQEMAATKRAAFLDADRFWRLSLGQVD